MGDVVSPLHDICKSQLSLPSRSVIADFFGNRRRPICARGPARLCGAHVRLCVRACGRAGPCSRQGPALFQEINKRCRVPPPTEPRQKVDADRRHTQGFSVGESGTCMAPHPSAIRVVFFFFRYFFSFFLFFLLEVQTRCIVGAADCVAWASLK